MSQVFEMQNAPSVEEYVRVLTALGDRVTDEHRALFRVHYYAPDRTATAKELAAWATVNGWSIVNSRYGKLGHTVCDELGITPELRPDDSYRWWSVWSRGWSTPREFVWQMLPRVAEALEQLGWVDPAAEFPLPDEILTSTPLVEGAVRRVTVNSYERNQVARQQCKAAHGTDCCICGFNFGARYGLEAEGYIHVHHVRPLSEVGQEYIVDPVEDLRPVCPNCHAVLHLGGRCRTIDEVRQILAKTKADLTKV